VGALPALGVLHDHAFLLPHGCRLPFTPAGKVFTIR
jgi:hypothetical protein